MQKNYKIIIFGCQMNYSDAARMAAVLENCGLVEAKTEAAADLVVIYSCSVRQMAEDRTYGKIMKLAQGKQRPRIVATGCMVSDKIWQKLLQKNRFDLCLPIDQMINLPKYLKKWKLIEKIPKDSFDHYLDIIPKNKQAFSAFIPIMTGCNNFCSYCAVPYTRGREVSRPMADIVAEAKRLAAAGCIELTLLGQNVNSYGVEGQRSKVKGHNHNVKHKNNNAFVKLLRAVSDIKQLKRIYFISSHPKDMSDTLIKLVGERENLANYIHLPIQSGDDNILKVMNRHYTRADYLKLIKKIRKCIPGVAIVTDVIVGFPGETEEQFANTCRVFAEVGYDMAFIAEYSPRPKTAAAKLVDDVPRVVKKRRKRILNDDYLMKSALANNRKLVEQTVPVLFHRKKRDGYIGYTEGLKQVHVKSNGNLVGQLLPVKITRALKWGLEGRL